MDSGRVSLQDGVGASTFVDSGSTSSDKNAEAYTNSKGEFRIELSGEFNACLSLRKDKYEWSDPQDGDGIMGFSEGHYQNVELVMNAEAFFDPYLGSKNPTFGKDTLFFEILGRSTYKYFLEHGFKYWITGWERYFYGIGPFTYFDGYYSFRSVGDTYHPFRTTFIRVVLKR